MTQFLRFLSLGCCLFTTVAHAANDSPLFEAVTNGNKADVEALLAKGADPNAKDTSHGRTPLHAAANGGHIDIAELLLAKGADINAKRTDGNTPLHEAAYIGKKDIAEWLLAKGANANAKDENGNTPLHMAVSAGKKEMVEWLLANRAAVDAKGADGMTPLHLAAYHGMEDMAGLLLAKGAAREARGADGMTPLHVAAYHGMKDVAALLVAKGSAVNAKDTSYGRTPLHAAVSAGKNDVAAWLLAQGAAVDAKGTDGMTPLHVAAFQGKRDMAELLLAKGAALDAKRKDGMTPLHVAAYHGMKDVAELFLAKGAAVNAKGMYGTPLQAAASAGKKDLVELLEAHTLKQAGGRSLTSVDGDAAAPLEWYSPGTSPGHGIYGLERKIDFNVLDGAFFDPVSGQVSLYGHYDRRYQGPRIPYLQHLAALLENPRPEFTLEWTPDSERRVKAFLNQKESRADAQRAARGMAQFLDPRTKTVNNTGRLLLPGWGIKPTRNGSERRGYLGADVAQEGEYMVRITRVHPGSPAATAGLRVGDVIEFAMDLLPLNPSEFHRMVGYLGAEAQIGLSIKGGERKWVRLGAAREDAWAATDWMEVFYHVMLQGAGPLPASTIDRIYAMNRTHGTPAFMAAYNDFLQVLGLRIEMDRLLALHGSTDLTASLLFPQVGKRLEEIFELPSGSIRNRYTSMYSRTGNHMQAGVEMDKAINEATHSIGERALSRVMAKAPGVQIAPELIDRTWGVRPEVSPRYLGVRPNTQLARAMLSGDYLGKRLVNMPELKSKFPTYMTQYEFLQRNPRFDRDRASYRMWISVDRFSAAQSPDRAVFEVREIAMRFNLREIGAKGRNLPPEPGGYGELLTRMYDELSQEFYVLHELKEASKLSGIAQWILARDKGFRLPVEGQAPWKSPAKLPGMIFAYLGGGNDNGTAPMTLFATGGVALTPYEWTGKVDLNMLAPVDASVVDLRHLSVPTAGGESRGSIVEPPRFENSSLARILNRRIDVPDWRPEGWVGRADKGDRTLWFVSTVRGKPGCDSILQQELLQKLATKARQLAGVERLINQLNASSPRLQAESAEMRAELEKDRDQFVEDTASMLADDLLEVHSFLKSKHAAQAVGWMAKATDLEEKFSDWEERMDAARSDSSRKKAEAMSAVLGELRDALEDLNSPQFATLRNLLGPFTWFNDAKDMADILETFSKLMIFQNFDVNRLNREFDARNAALGSIEPLHKKLGGEVDLLRNDPRLKQLCPGVVVKSR